MAINFKKPKYVIPLIALPFIFIFYFIAKGDAPKDNGKKSEAVLQVASQGVNPTLPGVSKNVVNQNLADKFAAYQQALKHQTDYSALGNIPDSNNNTGQAGSGLNYSSSYSPQEIEQLKAQRRLDSLQKALEQQSENIKNHRSPTAGSPYSSAGLQTETPEQIMARVRKIQAQYNQRYGINGTGEAAGNPTTATTQNGSSASNDLGEFREKMRIIDSMQQAASGNTASGSAKRRNRFDPSQDSTFHPMNVSLNRPVDNNFNTIRPFSADKSIKAIIDENEKVFAESRVRIKLLDNIYVGNNLIPKGTYLYAMVTGFQMHRINLTITSIMYNDNPLPVNLDVYDQDGYLGLYVPESNFREFSKEIGTSGTNGLSEIQLSNNQDIKSTLLQQLFQTSGSAVTNYINKDKAFVKYNYVIYLIENKSQH